MIEDWKPEMDLSPENILSKIKLDIRNIKLINYG